MRAYRITMICDDCQARDHGYVIGRSGDQADPLLLALAKGWETLHPEHKQIVAASPADVEVTRPASV